jgi:hypothetical protein
MKHAETRDAMTGSAMRSSVRAFWRKFDQISPGILPGGLQVLQCFEQAKHSKNYRGLGLEPLLRYRLDNDLRLRVAFDFLQQRLRGRELGG